MNCRKFSVVILLILILVNSMSSCSNSNDREEIVSSPSNNTYTIKPIETKAEAKTPEAKNPVITLSEFLSSETKHVYVKYEGITGSTSTYAMEYELWQKGSLTRIDYYKNNVLDSTLYADEESAMTYMHKSGNLIQALSPPEYYHDFYMQEYESASVKDGESSGQKTYSFTMDKFYKLPSAQAGYYVAEVRYVIDDTGILMQEITGNSSYGERPKSMNLVRNTFVLMEINIDLEDSLFVKPSAD